MVCRCTSVWWIKLDTGSEANILKTQTYNKIQAIPLRKSTRMLVTFSIHCITSDVEVTLPLKDQKIKFHVVPECQTILGKTSRVKLKLLARLDELAVNGEAELPAATEEEQMVSQKKVREYADVFSGLGLIKAGTTIHIDNNVTPVINPPRCIPTPYKTK